MESITIITDSKKERYEELMPQIVSLVADEDDLIANLGNISAALKSTFSDYSWVGFYLMKGGELVLGPFQGKVACVRISSGKGVCGTAAANKETLIVPNVSKFPGHIACDPDSKSEIVVPLINGDQVAGVLDIDSNNYDSFNEIDQYFLEKIGKLIITNNWQM